MIFSDTHVIFLAFASYFCLRFVRFLPEIHEVLPEICEALPEICEVLPEICEVYLRFLSAELEGGDLAEKLLALPGDVGLLVRDGRHRLPVNTVRVSTRDVKQGSVKSRGRMGRGTVNDFSYYT